MPRGSKKCLPGCTCGRHTRWVDWRAQHPTGGHEVGEIFANGRELVAYAGMRGTAHQWMWKCAYCGRVNGPNELATVKKGTYCLRGCNNGRNHHRWGGYEGFTGSFICNLRKHLVRGNRTLVWFPGFTDIEAAAYLWQLWVHQGGQCALSGRLMKLPQSYKSRKSASLDRIDSNKGYEIGNVQWTDPAINRLKRNWPEAEFFKMCKDVVRWQNKISHNKAPVPTGPETGALLLFDPSDTN